MPYAVALAASLAGMITYASVLAIGNTRALEREDTIPAPVTMADTSTASEDAPNEKKAKASTAITLPEAAAPALPYDERLLYIDGLLSGKAYEVGDELYLGTDTFFELLGIDVTYTSDGESAKIEGAVFELTAEKNTHYIVTNGRYQYVPSGYFVTDAMSGTASGAGSGGTGASGGGNMYLPSDAVERIFNVECEEDEEGNLRVDTADMKVIEGNGYYYDIHLDADIFYWLPHIINSETYGESLDSKLAVANVVLNRLKFDLFPDTIYGVIYDTKYAVQFTPVAIGGVKGTPDDLSYVAAFLAAEGYNNVGNSMYYVRPNASNSNTEWFERALVYYDTIGSHRFYYKQGNEIPDKNIMG